jgi:hypothetical protein
MLNLPVHGPTRPGPPHPILRAALLWRDRSARTVTTSLIAVRQADSLLRGRGTSLAANTRADPEAIMADLLARRMASTAATCHKVLKILYGWLAEEGDFDSPILSYNGKGWCWWRPRGPTLTFAASVASAG